MLKNTMSTYCSFRGRVLYRAALAAAALFLAGCKMQVEWGAIFDYKPDVVAPTLSGQELNAYEDSADGTTATLRFYSSEAGTYFVLVLKPSETAPENGAALESLYANAAIKATDAAAAGTNTVPITGLTEGTEYQVYLMVKDKAGNYSAVWISGRFTPTMSIVPVLSFPSVNAETDLGRAAVLNFISSKAGIYFVLVSEPAEEFPENGAALESLCLGALGAEIKFISTAAAGENTVNITGLSTNTMYRIHLAVKDEAGNYSEVWSSNSFTPTQGKSTPPPVLLFTGTNAGKASGTAAELYLSASKDGWFQIIVYPAERSAPADAAAFASEYQSASNKLTGMLEMGEKNTVQVSSLTTGTAYRAHAIMWDAWGLYSSVCSSNSFTPIQDISAVPVLSALSVRNYVGTAFGTTAMLNFTSDTAGTYFVVVYSSTMSAPLSGAVLETAFESAAIKMTGQAAPENGNTLELTGLTEGVEYRLHLTVKNMAGKYSDVWSSANFTPARAGFQIIYDAGEGTLNVTIATVLYGLSYTLAVPSRPGWTFAGWYTGAGGTGTQLTNAGGASLAPWTGISGITVYARWLVNTFRVIYNAEEGTVSPAEDTVTYNADYLLALPSRTGYTFAGWYSGSDGTGTQLTGANGVSLNVWNLASDTMVYARWVGNTYTVTYDAGGGTVSPSTGTVTYDASYTLAVASKTGYTFAGWYSGVGGTGTQLTDSSGASLNVWKTAGDAEVYAGWDIAPYTITYNATGGTVSPSTATVTYEAPYTLAVPSRNGYTFAGWYSSADETGTQLTDEHGASLVPWEGTSNATVYARWTGNPYTVSYSAEEGTVSPGPVVVYGSSYTLAVPSKTGWTFTGWYLGAGGTGTQLTDAGGASLNVWNITADTTVYAGWLRQYLVFYDANGGSVTPSQATVTYSQSYTLAVPTSTVFGFVGWYLGAGGTGIQLTGANGASLNVWNLTSDTTVYAGWSGNTYTVTYDARGGTVSPSTGTVTNGASYTLAVPTRTGYTFGGWYTEADGAGTQLTNANGVSYAVWAWLSGRTVYAKWTGNTYTVTYEMGDTEGLTASPSATVEVTYGSAYNLDVPARVGYSFGGWYTGAGGTGTQLTGANGASLVPWNITSDLKVYPKWTGNTYMVIYVALGGTVSPSTASVTYGASYTLAVPTRSGYTFGGWWTGEGGTGTQLTYANGASLSPWNIATPTMVYAKWTANIYTVNYNAGEGTVSPSTAPVTYGQSYTLAVPSRAGYIFGGWYTGANGTGNQLTDEYGESLAPWEGTSSITAYARWTAIVYTYIVTYNAAGGTVSPSSKVVTYGASYTLAVPGARTAYTFGGWYTGEDGTGTQLTYANGASLVPWNIHSDTLVHAKWTANTYTVSYDAAGGTVSPSSKAVSYGASYTLAVPTRSGYTFGGWWTGEDGTGTQLTNTNGESLSHWAIASNTTVYAKWIASQYITVTYNANGGTVSPTSSSVVYGTSYTLAVPVRAGYNFVGWYTEAGGTGTQLTYANGAGLAPWAAASNTTVHAGWASVVYTVTCDAGAGTVSPTQGTAASGAYYILPVPIRTGFSFAGWYSGAGGTGNQLTDANGASLAAWQGTSGITVYAKWTGNSYTVFYNAAGGAAIPSQTTVTYGASYSLVLPARSGYTFGGWYTGVGGTGTQLTDANGLSFAAWLITSNTTAHAMWTPNSYTAVYNAAGGTVSPSQTTVTYDASYSLAVPTRPGYAFSGWYTGTGGTGTQLTGANGAGLASWVIHSNITVHARWTGNPYTVVYNAADGTVSPSQTTVTYGASYTLAVPLRNGYAFGGWYTGTGGTGTQLTDSNGESLAPWATVSNIEVYARWETICTVTYNAEGGTVSPGTATVAYGSHYTLAVPTMAGSNFVGWYTEAGGTGTQLTGANGASLVPWAIASDTMVYARWAAFVYTITLNAGAGTVSPATGTAASGAYFTLTAPVRVGYTFAGWYSDAGGTGTQLTYANGASLAVWQGTFGITVYARWTAKDYKVTLDAQGGTISPAQVTVTYDANYVLGIPSRTGYTFVGWFKTASEAGGQLTNDTNGGGLAPWTIASDTTAYARWEAIQYAIVYNANGGAGTPGPAFDAYYDTPCTLPLNTFTRANYTFIGWALSSDGAVLYSDGAVVLNLCSSPGSVNLYAKWRGQSYILTLNATGGSVTPSVSTVLYNETYTLPAPARVGYTFGGWYTGTGGTGTQLTGANGASLASWLGTSDTTVYAKWTGQDYSLTADPDGGTLLYNTPFGVRYDNNYTLDIPQRTGYTFGGWWTGRNGTGTQLTDSNGASLAPWTGTSDITVYAKWTVNTYTVTYNAEQGALPTGTPSTVTVTYGQPFTLVVPLRAGYDFVGWVWINIIYNGSMPSITEQLITDGTGAGLAPWAITSNIAVHAKWSMQ
jgi:uncharacterized repeat protein (TIGR02543 family)